MRRLLTKLLGDRGERAAARYLRRCGFRILEHQHRTNRGEIDLVCLEGDRIVFVEVKTRRTRRAGHPVESVTPVKQQQLTRLALAWLKRHRLLERPARFDVVTVDWPDDARRPVIEHIRDAFDASGCDSMYS